MERPVVWSVLFILFFFTVIISVFGSMIYYKVQIYILQSRVDQINNVIVHATKLGNIYRIQEKHDIAQKYEDYVDLCYRRLRVKESQIRYYDRKLEQL